MVENSPDVELVGIQPLFKILVIKSSAICLDHSVQKKVSKSILFNIKWSSLVTILFQVLFLNG
jgi:hypothetical protein